MESYKKQIYNYLKTSVNDAYPLLFDFQNIDDYCDAKEICKNNTNCSIINVKDYCIPDEMPNLDKLLHDIQNTNCNLVIEDISVFLKIQGSKTLLGISYLVPCISASCFLSQHGFHVVQPDGLSQHEPGGIHRAVRQHGPGDGLVLERQLLGAGVEDDLVDTHDRTHTEGRNTDFVLGTLALPGTAAVGPGVGPNLLHGVEQHQSRAAGRVHLAVVVGFHDLNIRVGEIFGSLLSKAAQHRDAQAHVAAEKHGNLPGSGVDQGLFRLGVAGGADDRRRADLFGVVQYAGNGGMVGEIHHHIRFHGSQFVKGLGYAVFTVNADLAHHFFTEDAADQLAHGAVGAANHSSHTFIPSFLISLSRTALVASSMGVRGSRRVSVPKPKAAVPALAGMGFTSLNKALIRGSRSHCIFAAAA